MNHPAAALPPGGRGARRGRAAMLWVPGLLVAVAAAVATAHGLYEVAHAARVPEPIAWLYPVMTDGLALVAYAATARLRGSAARYAWWVVVLAAGLSGLAQAVFLATDAPVPASGADPDAAVGFVAPPLLRFGVGAWPAVAAAIVAHLLYLLATADHDDPPDERDGEAPTYPVAGGLVSALTAPRQPADPTSDPYATPPPIPVPPAIPVAAAEPTPLPMSPIPSSPAAPASVTAPSPPPIPVDEPRPVFSPASAEPLFTLDAVQSSTPPPPVAEHRGPVHPDPAPAAGIRAALAAVPDGTGEQDRARSAGAPARERARVAAVRFAHRHGSLPTVTEVQETAEVSRGTAAAALKALRDQPVPLHLLPTAATTDRETTDQDDPSIEASTQP